MVFFIVVKIDIERLFNELMYFIMTQPFFVVFLAFFVVGVLIAGICIGGKILFQNAFRL